MFARPGIKTAGRWPFATTTLWRNVKAENLGIIEQHRKIGRLEKPFWLGVNRIERFLRQRIAQVSGATGQRGQRRRPKDRDANIGEASGAAAQLAQPERQAGPRRQPVRRQGGL